MSDRAIHHSRKENQAKPSDASQMVRGSGDFRNAVDLMLYLRAKKDDKDRFVVEQNKIRSGIHPFVVYRDNCEDGSVHHLHDGPADQDSLGADQAMLGQILAQLRSGESVLARTVLALRLGLDPRNGTSTGVTPAFQVAVGERRLDRAEV